MEEPAAFVEIVFGKKDLSEEEAETIIKKFTDEEFVIEKIERYEDKNETKAIIGFVDKKSADNFVEIIVNNVNDNEALKDIITTIKIIDYYLSSALTPRPSHTLNIFVLLFNLTP